MKRIIRNSLGLLALGAFFAAVAAGPALADDKTKPAPAKGKADATKKADVTLATAKVEFNASVVKMIKRKAITYKPIELGKYKPDDMVKGPDGRQWKASEYVAKVNELGKKLAEMGHSLSDGDKAVLAESDVKAADQDKKSAQVAAKHLKFDAKTMKATLKRDELLRRHAGDAQKDEPRVMALKKLGDPKLMMAAPGAKAGAAPAAKPVPPKVNKWSWNWELGRRNLVAAALNAKLETSGNADRVQVRGEASADGYLANRKQNLLKATGVLTVPKAGDSTLNVAVSVLGRTVYNKNLSKKTNFTQKDEKSTSIDKSVSFRFQLGPIPLKVKMGARGTVGVRYFVGVRPLSAEAQFVPFVRAEAYAECGVDIFIAGAGVGGKLRLIDFELRIGGELAVKFDKSNRPQLVEHAYVKSDISMLHGSLYVHAYINYLFGKKRFEWTLWKWKGLKTGGYLVNHHKTHNLF